MPDIARVQVFDSQGEAYYQAFHVFLEHTDQKINARRWLDDFLKRLPQRRVFIDAGAGTGQTTAWLSEQFERTIAIEPNPSLNAELKRTCPQAEVLGQTILQANPSARGDFVLCAHVLYYIDRPQWLPHATTMASWLAEKGTLIIILQNHETDCMRMLDTFLGQRFDLAALAKEFEEKHCNEYAVERHLVPAQVTTPDLATAYVIAEFMLNLLPMSGPPARSAVEDYIAKHFRQPDGGFRFSCHQDFLTIRRR
jgi:SAM-dependent methyltransferase